MALYGRTTSLSVSGGNGGRSRSLWARSVCGGAGGSGLYISQAPSYLVSAGGGAGGGFYSGVGLGPGIGANSAASFRAGLKSGAGIGGGTTFRSGAGIGGGAGGAIDGILGNEKFTMKVLNERLASYLKKVHMLTKANAELELKISQFVESRSSPTAWDYSDSLTIITDLQTSINDAIRSKGMVQISLDNATLAAEDFRMKYENELAMRQTVEADVSELKRMMNDLTMNKSELMLQIDTLNEEKSYLKKVHKEEMEATRSKMSGQIHVEVDSAPQQDLISVLDDIRDHYEAIAGKNRRELEAWFKSKLETLKQEVATSTQTGETSKTELSVEKTKVQGLELELHSTMAVKLSLAAKLTETQAFYSAYLSGYQQQVMSIEEQLLQLRADLERQSRDYQMLLDIKSRLELEIAEYRRLLDLGAIGSSSSATKSTSQDQGER